MTSSVLQTGSTCRLDQKAWEVRPVEGGWTDISLGYSQLKTHVQTQTESPIWNQILTFRIQVLLFHHAFSSSPPTNRRGLCKGRVMEVRGGRGQGVLLYREHEKAQDILQ